MRCGCIGLCLALLFGSSALAQQSSDLLGRLHDDLRLAPAQEEGWRQYQAAMGASAQAMARRQSTERLLPQLQTPRRLALLDAAMSQDLADFRRQSEAIRAFYASLTPLQQRTFDAETAPGQGAETPPR
ncbi:MAG TPA: Spy/CpxP family protein refolding chaperone [Caulobacteraceae bacterium]|nr:Spy/CpxP family protein refolding chaperone [Caulobacteraceae bacterium]